MSKRAKVRREDRLVHGDEVLAARGVDTSAPDDRLLPALVAQIGADPDADLTIADLIGSIPLQESADHLAAWQRREPVDKHLKRVIRQSLFRLEQRGIRPTGGPDAPAAPRTITPVVDQTPAGWLSPLDGGGNRLAWLSLPRVEGGYYVLRTVLNDESGLRQAIPSHMNRTQFREERAHAERYGATMIEAPHRYVDWLMYEAHAKGAPREGGVSYPLLRGEIYDAPAEPVLSPAAERLANFPADRQEAILGASGDLFKEREFHGWVIAADRVAEQLARFREARESNLVLDRKQVSERLTGILDTAFEECFPEAGGGLRPLYAGRMGEMALWYSLAGREETACSCWAVRLALEETGRRLQKVPFLQALVFRAFLHLMPREDGGDGEKERSEAAGPDEPSFIVRPE